jgi:hypothetical protein
MDISQDNSRKSNELTTQRLRPIWSPLFNLGLASFVGVIAAVVAFASTNDLRDGGTLVAIPIGIVVWFLGDILRWRSRYPMRLFLMVPIFVALVCTVSIRILQKANQRRMARLAEVKCLKSIYLNFDLTEQDVQSIAFFPAEVEITLAPNINHNQKQQIEDAIKNRK